MSLPRHTNSDSQRLQVGTRATLIPSRTSTSPSILAVHTHPKYWPDPLIWNPERWITKESGEEALVTPPRDTFLPWSDGPQNCPGAKFSQVEFVAVIALIMQKNRLTIKHNNVESEEQARTREGGTERLRYAATIMKAGREQSQAHMRGEMMSVHVKPTFGLPNVIISSIRR
jgi:cytochrome P450